MKIMSGAYRQSSKRNPFPWQQFTNPRKPTPLRQCSSPTSRMQLHAIDLDDSTVMNYFKKHPKCLDRIILRFSTEKILFLMQVQEKLSNRPANAMNCKPVIRKLSLQMPKKYNPLPSIKTQSETFLKLTREPDLKNLLFHASDILATALQVDWFSLYMPCHNIKDLCEYQGGGMKKKYGSIGKGKTVSAEAAFLCTTLLVRNLPENLQYPEGVGHPERDIHSVLSIPLVFPSGDLLGVIEFCSDSLKAPFSSHDLKIAHSLLSWMVTSLHQATLHRIILLQSKLNDFLLDATKELGHDMISIDKLVEKILLFGKELVRADRCALFLINEEKNQIHADYFCEGGTQTFCTRTRIRFSCDKGICGHVYKTGQAVNIPDVYADDRFNADIDQITGYYTKNILCMPIVSKSRVLGVIQMVNSLSNDHFTFADEHAFKAYAVYCALAMHNCSVYNRLHLIRTEHAVAMEQLQYHMVAPEEEYLMLKEDTPPESIPDTFTQYIFNAFNYEQQLPQMFVYLIHDLFGKDVFDFTKLSRFIMTVRKSYRPVSYHNWMHGFKVAHALYCMIKEHRGMFLPMEAMALVIAGLCHDLDHRGYNSAFYQKFDQPMAELYTTSVMEQHHYGQAVTILQLEGHDIFSFLSPEDNKEMLNMIREAIIATDLSLFFNTKKQIATMFERKTFDIKKEECKSLFKELMMTAADLSAVALPWNAQYDIAARLYLEYYRQGDMEKTHLLTPIEIMDRNFEYEMPKQQIAFLLFICDPMYVSLVDVLPNSRPLLDGMRANLKNWQTAAAKIAKKNRTEKLQ